MEREAVKLPEQELKSTPAPAPAPAEKKPASEVRKEAPAAPAAAAAPSPILSPAPAAVLQPAPFFTHQGHLDEFAPKITVIGVGGAGGNAVNNMITRELKGVDFLVANTDAQHLSTTLTEDRLQLGKAVTQGLGCGANPDAGRQAAFESREEILERVGKSHMVFITAGMGGGTGTGAAPVIAETCIEAGILTVAVVTKVHTKDKTLAFLSFPTSSIPSSCSALFCSVLCCSNLTFLQPFRFEGTHRMRLADEGLGYMKDCVDTLIVIPNQNLFNMVEPTTSLMDAFQLADDVLLAGVRSVTDLMVNPGLINLDFADVQAVMAGMGNAMMGTGEADGDDRAVRAAEDALSNPLLGKGSQPALCPLPMSALTNLIIPPNRTLLSPGEVSCRSAKGLLVNITGGADMTLFEVDAAASRITEEVEDGSANIIFGSAYDGALDGRVRVSVVATGIEE
ncbi:unnamed protein product [Chrysoparadoxa australica]